jgi:hypothetical protein
MGELAAKVDGMFLRNRTTHRVTLARGHLTEEFAIFSVNLEMRYRIRTDGALESIDGWARKPSDPPDVVRLPLWAEVSLTAVGEVRAPATAPFVSTTELGWGDDLHRLVVFGPRYWRRRLGGLEPSEPERFESMPLSWGLAFGGSYQEPPGLDAHSGLPHPGGTVAYPLNPAGIGFYATEKQAVDRPLPRIERTDQLVRQWSDRPLPGGLAPCPMNPALRLIPLDSPEGGDPAIADALFERALRVQHHAPIATLARRIDSGTEVRLTGAGARPLRFVTPTSPLRVRSRTRRDTAWVQPRIRSVHVDADDETVAVVFGHMQHYAPERAPEWIEVMQA